MKAAVLEAPGKIAVKDIPMRVCAADEVLVKVSSCGICGSDLKYFKGENPWALHTLGHHVDNPPNIILGHEFAGVVTAAGSAENVPLIGKRVFVEPYNTCGRCDFCHSGQYNLCRQTKHIGHGAGWGQMDYYPGGMAEYCPAWATHVFELPDSVSDEEATFLDPLAVAVHAVNISQLRPGCTVLVLGSGPVGLLIAQVARACGAAQVACTDRFTQALAVAKTVGIDYPVDVRAVNLVPFMQAHTQNRGVDIIFDTVGSAETQNQALQLLAGGGTLVNLVASTDPLTCSLMDISSEKHITTSANNLYEDVVTALRLLAAGRVQVKGFALLQDRSSSHALKVIVQP